MTSNVTSALPHKKDWPLRSDWRLLCGPVSRAPNHQPQLGMCVCSLPAPSSHSYKPELESTIGVSRSARGLVTRRLTRSRLLLPAMRLARWRWLPTAVSESEVAQSSDSELLPSSLRGERLRAPLPLLLPRAPPLGPPRPPLELDEGRGV